MDIINQYNIEHIYITYCTICKCVQCLRLVGVKSAYYGISLIIITQNNILAQNVLYFRKNLDTMPGLVAPNTQHCVEIFTIRQLCHVLIPSCPFAQRTASPVPICLPLQMWSWFGMMRQLRVQPRCTHAYRFDVDTFVGEVIWVR